MCVCGGGGGSGRQGHCLQLWQSPFLSGEIAAFCFNIDCFRALVVAGLQGLIHEWWGGGVGEVCMGGGVPEPFGYLEQQLRLFLAVPACFILTRAGVKQAELAGQCQPPPSEGKQPILPSEDFMIFYSQNHFIVLITEELQCNSMLMH